MSATPGPWRFVPWHVEEGPPAVRCAEGWIVATTSSDDDARLIAAAPDLAEALFNLLAAVGEIGLTQAQIEAMAKACDAASAALIKSGRVMG